MSKVIILFWNGVQYVRFSSRFALIALAFKRSILFLQKYWDIDTILLEKDHENFVIVFCFVIGYDTSPF